jgi:long-chain fatty acid transport protein
MQNQRKPSTTRKLALAALLVSPLTAAMATNGYFSHGYGMKAKGMGGASLALTDNAFAGANNPAIAAWAGDRLEAGVDVFMPERSMSRTDSMAGLNASVTSDSTSFVVPEFGYNKKMSEKLGVGVTVYGNGGMNTDYAGGQIDCGAGAANVLCGSGRLGVDLQQLIVAPTIAYKFSDNSSMGFSPLLVQQIFKADGLQMFSTPAQHVTNEGYDSSTGVGFRLGYFRKLSEHMSMGASYAPKISMGKFSKYSKLFAGDGGFDIPENYALGLAYAATPALTVALDFERIAYAGVASISNPSTNQAPLGAANGQGFGWSDIDVWKLGVQWQSSDKLSLRAGVNIGDNPIKSRDVTFNILAPGTVTTHYTLGGTYALSDTSELTVSYMVAPESKVSGSSLFNAFMGGAAGNETIKMSQQSLGIQFGWHWK